MRGSLLLLVFVCGCAPLWNAGNRGQFESDVDAVLQANGAKLTKADCNMIGTKRAGTCVLLGTAADRKALIQGLGLQEAESGGERGGCRSHDSFKGDVKLHVAPGKVDTFSEFRLFEVVGGQEVCIEATYSSG